MANPDTELVINVIGLPPQSAWGVVQKIRPISEAGQPRRDVDGVLHDRSLTQFRKYITEISCEAMHGPAFEGIWPGQEVTIDCVEEFTRLTVDPAEREVVPGSEYTVGDYTRYRPRLYCRVLDWDSETDEAEATTTWNLSAAEI